MPPKKKGTEDKRPPMLGRPSNNVSMGIVGLPNVGKSSMFNLLSKLDIPAENRPFCTIEPNVARVPVPDARYDFLVETFRPRSEVPASLTITDIAGLVSGAASGAGLGNAFLSHIQAVDAIYHMVRCFKDKEVVHVDGEVNPIRDMEVIHNELIQKDLAMVKDMVAALGKKVARGPEAKEHKLEYDTLAKCVEMLEAGQEVRFGMWDAKEVDVINRVNFLTAKRMVYLANLSMRDYIRKSNKWLPIIAEWLKARGTGEPCIPVSVEFEQNISFCDTPEARDAKETELGARSVLPKVIKAGYRTLRLINFFTCGEDEVRAWSIREGTKAPQAAGVIHTDFEHGFICADVQAYDDFKELGSEAAVRAAGKLRTEGRKYDVKDADIIFFKFNPSGGGGGKKK